MRLALLALLVGCSSPSTPLPNNVGAATPSRIPKDLGSLAVVTARAHADSTPRFVPTHATIPLVDPARRMPPNTPVLAIDARGASGTFTSGEPTQILFGCDGNQIDVTPLAGKTALAPGIAWLRFDAEARPTALPASTTATPAESRTQFRDLLVVVTRDAKRFDRGTLRFAIAGTDIGGLNPFARTLMDGADPQLATIDIAEGGPGIPRPLAAWSVDGSGHAPFLVAIERPGWEGTSLEAWLVESASTTQIEPMTVYLYQCAF